MKLAPEQVETLIQSRNMKIYTAIIVIVLNLYFLIGICIGHIPITYMISPLIFNIICFVLQICGIVSRNFNLTIIRFIMCCMLISTIIFSIYYVKTLLFPV